MHVTSSRHGVLEKIKYFFVQIDSLKKGFDGFDKEGGTISQTTMMMILKSMGVDVNKVDMENYSAEVDEEETGKFSFNMFCQGEEKKVLLKSILNTQWLPSS